MNANPGLEKIFNKEKEQRRVETVQAVVDIGLQVSDIVRTEGKIAGEKTKLVFGKKQVEEKSQKDGILFK
ncbi:hypothetical protein [Erwinia sp. CGal63]|uniref:hypothetical protein n=1 Tax=Erwinia sp. CGal63 TaxID=2919889 RepID=UPI003008EA6B